MKVQNIWRHYCTITKHRHLVRRHCFKIGLYWQGLTHDLSKYSPRAGRTMKDTIDNELDKFDTDNRFLFMDPSSEKVSFTSDKNRAPKTLQIVLRTDEISVDEDDAKTADAEVAKIKESPLRRMWNVLVQMWKAMVSIFKNR